jgi:glutamyl/glutaminyl-tRNA synthetase
VQLENWMPDESDYAVMHEALQAALQSHVKMGKAYRCECSLCAQIRDALALGAGRSYGDRIREECALVADWKGEAARTSGSGVDGLAVAHKAAREIGDRIRALKNRML